MGTNALKSVVLSPVVKPSRAIPTRTSLYLFTRAGGRCQFNGCNDYLLEHHVTKKRGIYAERAHIWAYRPDGARGHPEGVFDPHDIENLMLLCPKCHKHIDDHPDDYPVDRLKKDKREQEARILRLTATSPDLTTVAVLLRGRVADEPVTIGLDEIQDAVLPRHVGERGVHEIDLTGFRDSGDPAFWSVAAAEIRERMSNFYSTKFEEGKPEHVSVFALAPIPLLMTLGACLSDKVPTTLFQRHRETQGWVWKESGPEVQFRSGMLREGTDPTKIALLVSVSGRLGRADLPPGIDAAYTVYHIEPDGRDPHLGLLETNATLEAFRRCYMGLIRAIDASHPKLNRIHMFPAVPAPFAVAMGRDLLSKRDPGMLVYDYDKAAGGFAARLEINQR
jgi:5-methylcytosine-specific restriction endonuclease McrA